MPAVFLSYRRGDASGYAVGMKNDLRARGFQVFMDLDSIKLGEPYPKVIQDALNSSDALVALIGNNWLAASDKQGRRRLDDERDFVRREIAAALERDILVVPTLVDGAVMPAEEALPPNLAQLATRQALKLDNEHWDEDVKRLIDAVAAAALPEPPVPPQKKPLDEQTGARRPGGFAVGRRTWLVVGALAAAAAIAIAALLLARPGDKADVERVALPRFGDGGRDVPRAAASAEGARVVAVGGVVRGEGADAPRSAAAWGSEDGGATWVVGEVEESERASRQEMRAVGRLSDSAFVAVGQQDGDVAAWRSDDGLAWTAQPLLRRRGDQFVHGLLVRQGLVVAVGSEGITVGEGRDAAVWWSGDGGTTWSPARLKGFAGAENQEIKSIVAGRNGVLVAVGYDGNVGEAAAWFSRDDAQTWQRVDIDAREDTEQMAAVASVPSGLVAVGREGDAERADAAVWKSTNNGRKWRRIESSAFDTDGEQALTGVVDTPAGLFAVGSEKVGDGRRTAAIWRSDDDGEGWKRLSASGLEGDAGSITTAVAVADVVLALGEGGGSAAAWLTEAS
jgi:hypothetical protein